MARTVILSTARTPFGKMGGGLATVNAAELGGVAIAGALERAGVAPDQVQQVSYGQVIQAGQGQIPSRQAQINGGIPKEVPSETVNKVCDANLDVTGGMESMSLAPYLLPGARSGFRMGDVKAVDSMTHDGLTNPFTHLQMIAEASTVSNEVGISREEMDAWSARSHELAQKAKEAGVLAEEIVPVTVKGRKGDTVVDEDEAIRPGTTAESLSGLRAVGGEDATHTAGNAPGVNDGAGALVLASEEWAEANGKTPMATIVGYGQIGDEYACLAKTPALAAKAALDRLGKTPADVDLWEVNEAFASVTLNTIKMLDIDPEKMNVNGGAVALGHPIGASGARVIGALVRELQRRGGGLGCAAICSGGGQGDAILVEV